MKRAISRQNPPGGEVSSPGGTKGDNHVVASPYGLSVISSGGFDSLTEKYQLATKIKENGGRPVEVLHIGDYDQSGVHTALNLAEDVRAFLEELGGEADFRLAVTPEQIERLSLPTAPPKRSDNRAYGSTATCQGGSDCAG